MWKGKHSAIVIDHLAANSDINLIYACTLVGASVRCWSLQRGDDFLRPFWSGAGSSYAQYLDVGEDANRDALLEVFGFMANVPLDGALPLDMQHSDIGRVIPNFGDDSVSGGAKTPADFDYALASINAH